LASNIHGFEPGSQFSPSASLNGFVKLGDRLRAQKFFSQHHEGDDDGSKRHWQVDGKAPPPIGVCEVS
jgi:hypothetical protein